MKRESKPFLDDLSRQLPQAPPRSSSGHCTFASVLKLEMLSMEDLVRNNAKQLWTSCATSSIGTFLVGGKVLAKAEEMKKEIFSTVHTDKEILADRCIVLKRVVIILKSNVQVADPWEKKGLTTSQCKQEKTGTPKLPYFHPSHPSTQPSNQASPTRCTPYYPSPNQPHPHYTTQYRTPKRVSRGPCAFRGMQDYFPRSVTATPNNAENKNRKMNG